MAIGEIFLGSFFQVLFDKLTSLALDFAQREGINAVLLDEWKEMLKTISVVLDGAEDKQLRGDRQVKLWLDDVRDLAYAMEDLLDEFEIEATQAKSEVESSTSRGQWKRKFSFFSQSYSLVSETKVQEINGRLEKILARKAHLSLGENAADRSNNTNKRLPSTSLPELRFFGREEEEAQLLERLISDVQNSDDTLSIVPIVGMGGVGKTTLAQRLYNHPGVSSYFETRAWVCVSDVFDVLNITKTILQFISELSCEGKDLNWLQVKLKDSLSGKKFLVVLDDVWNEKYAEWTSLLRPFQVGAKGSKIIITTRNHPVVSLTRAPPYLLKELSIDNCTSLLADHALGARNFDGHLDLEIIGKKIAGKCRGLPLAAKMLGGLLCNKENPDEWEAIFNNRIWDVVAEDKDEVLPVLKLSYMHLPSHLKRCFAYCAIFPKDYEIERDELALLWIAEGFLDEQKAKKSILRLGRNYFDELVSRSFFQQSSVHTSKFLMHDLLNDLAQSIASMTCYPSRESQVMGDEDDTSFEEKARYASFVSPHYVTSKSLRAYGRMKVFSLCHCRITEVPNCVSDLKHLRYLNLSYTEIKRLPESIGTLCKLQALILRGCWHISMLPPDITKLVSLQFLDIRSTKSLEEMPSSIGNLKNLIILSKFVVGPKKGSQLKELKNLPHLQGELLLSKLQKVEEVRDALDANLFEKRGLSNLILLWDKNFADLQNGECEAKVLHSLQPHINIENLTISCYGGGIFPSWLGGQSYSKIVSLCLRDCHNIRSLPSLGQLPSLKELSLEGLKAISNIGFEFYGTRRPFPSLTTLKFERMSVWKDWSLYDGCQEEEVPFFYLRHLVVRNCPKLIGTLPCQLDHLIKLEIHSSSHLNNSTSEVRLSSLCELHLKDCSKEILKSFVNLTSLTILKIENLVEFVCFDHGFMSCLVMLKELHIKGCDKLTYLWQDGDEMRTLNCLQELAIDFCPRFKSFMAREGEILKSMVNLTSLTILKIDFVGDLVCFDHGFMSCLVNLKELNISHCRKLTYLWQDGNEMQNLTCLKRIYISTCSQFTSFVAGEGEIELPYNLEMMDLYSCKSLEKLPTNMHTLRHLRIYDCPKIIGLIIPLDDPSSNNPMSQLESLEVVHCDSLTSFPFAKGRYPALKTLHIEGCKGMESLEVMDCKNLGSIPQYLHMLSHLTRLDILHCPALEIEDFPPLPITLSHLELVNCPKIKSLPNQWHHLTSLQTLDIKRCQNIKCFPEGGLPPYLRVLRIRECENLERPVKEWGLRMLTTLKHLEIDFCMGGEGEKGWFPSEDEDAWSLFFPSSLTSLNICSMRNVERLSSGLHNHLSSLKTFAIIDCPKLRYLPEDGLPCSLISMEIYGCKILKDQCSKPTDDQWPLIQEIPHFYI